MPDQRALVIGYGNPGRKDDGLGPALAEAVTARNLKGVSVEQNYQLMVEDAARVAEHDLVVFADAHRSCDPPFTLYEVEPDPEPTFTTHSVSPGAVLSLAREHFGAKAKAYVLGIRGYDLESFEEGLTDRARANLEQAIEFIGPFLEEGEGRDV
jgi:hydrogenase maturation protease